MSTTLAILGAGNMGAALAGGLLKQGFTADHLWLTDPDISKCNALQSQFPPIHVHIDNLVAVEHADVILFAVKPQVMAEVAAPLINIIKKHQPLIISIAAGIHIAKIQQWLGEQTAIVRCMPNTPALIGAGMSALFANPHVTPAQRQIAETLLAAVGKVLWLNREEQFDAVTALSGSGPAYFFLLMDALQQSGQALGLSPQDAQLLTIQTALGAARMANESVLSPAELQRRVTSPGGTTAAALNVLENADIRAIFNKALIAARDRSRALS